MERIKSGQFTVIKLQAGLNFFSPPIKLKKLATRYTKQAFSSGLQIESFLKNFTFLFFKKKIFLFIHLAALGLSCGMWVLVACGIYFPNQGLNPGPPH